MKMSSYFLMFYSIPRKLTRKLFILWNRIFYRLRGVSYGSNMKIFNHIYLRLSTDSKIIIGDNFVFTSGDCINPICRNIKGSILCESDAEIKIGNNVGISSACLWSRKKITIGNNVKIGGNCLIIDTDAHSLDYKIRRSSQDGNNVASNPIVIEDDVWIGAECIILKGVTIGARTVIGAGSVVTKSIPSDSIAAGNPCRVIRTLQQTERYEREPIN